MPNRAIILKEFNDLLNSGKEHPFDFILCKYMNRLSQYTKRNTILYATNWTISPNSSAGLSLITDEDIPGFMDIMYGLDGDKLDIILHSQGGSAEATEAIVTYLRGKFSDIRVIIPQAAMSAATMLACAADLIIMGKQSSLGPIDPQMIIQTRSGIRVTPAQAIIDEFEEAKKASKEEAETLNVWAPILNQYTPGLLRQCTNAKALAAELVKDWLEKHMFAGEDDAGSKAAKIAQILSAHDVFKSHSRHISKNWGRNIGLKIINLEDEQTFQDLVLSVFHATNIIFQNTGIIKIIENHNGRSYTKEM